MISFPAIKYLKTGKEIFRSEIFSRETCVVKKVAKLNFSLAQGLIWIVETTYSRGIYWKSDKGILNQNSLYLVVLVYGSSVVIKT